MEENMAVNSYLDSRIRKAVSFKQSLSCGIRKASKKQQEETLCGGYKRFGTDIYMLSGNEVCAAACGRAGSFQ